MKTCKLATAVVAILAGATVSSNAVAATKWERNHPRRDQVVDRVARQNKRIATERKEGDLTEDRSVRLQQRADARANGGHITRKEQRLLNQELNANSKAIGK